MDDSTRPVEQRRAHIAAMFALFNAGAFDEMLSIYAEDVAFAATFLTDDDGRTMAGEGRGEPLRSLLHRCRDRFGSLEMVDAFPAGDQVSIVTRTAYGGSVHFSIQTSHEAIVTRIFVFEVKRCPSRMVLEHGRADEREHQGGAPDRLSISG